MMPEKLPRAKRRISKRRRISFIKEIFVLYYGIKDPVTPFYAKLIAFAALVYLISPIDLIPDFIPIAGYLDDLVIVPLLLHAAFTFLPSQVKESALIKTQKHIVRLYIVLTIILLFLVAIMSYIFILLKNFFHL
jgi:uncharacterized membrane protein YkvA (DUF1232 family)